MILIDANLLIYAYNSEAPLHQRAKAWLEAVLSRSAPVGLPWNVMLAFLRITTHGKIFPEPLSPAAAEAIVDAWLERPCVAILEPGPQHWTILRQLLSEGQIRGPRVMDAHLAAVAIEHGATLCTTDRDFSRFPGLSWRNPLAAEPKEMVKAAEPKRRR